MPQSRSVIARRARLHANADHSQCDPKRCADLIRKSAINGAMTNAVTDDHSVTGADKGHVTVAVTETVRSDLAQYATEFNPEQCAMCRITMRAAYAIADKIDNGDTRQISELRRLQSTLRACQPSHVQNPTPNPLDGIRDRRAQSAGYRDWAHMVEVER